MEVPEWARILTLASAGGAAKYLHGYLEGKPFTTSRLMASIIVSGFCGWTLADVARWFQPSSVMIAAGVGGWVGAEGLRVLIKLVIKKADKYIEDDKPDKPV